MDTDAVVKQIDTTRVAITRVREEYQALFKLVEESPQALEMAKAARKLHKGGDMKEKLEQLRMYVLDPGSSWKPSCKKAKFFHLDGLGLFHDVLSHGWKRWQEEETFDRITQVLRRARNYGAAAVCVFTWLRTRQPGHAHLNRKIPWEIEDGLVNFERPNERYRELWERFVKTVDEAYMRLIPQAHMAKYCYLPFEGDQNVSGVRGFFHETASPYTLGHGEYLLNTQLANGMVPMIKPLNEYSHGGNDELFHRGANWHKMFWEFVSPLMHMTDLVVDVSHCDACVAQLAHHSSGNELCSKCGTYAWDNKESYNRLVLAETHKVSILDDLERGHVSVGKFFGSKNWQMKASEDGSNNPKCNIVPIPGWGYRLGDAEQVSEMLVDVWGRCNDSSVKKHFYWGLFPMEVMIPTDNEQGIKAYYHVDKIDWERFDAAQTAHVEVHG